MNELEFYIEQMGKMLSSPYRRCQEYGRYLRRYFNPEVERVDGMDFDSRMKSEPMPYNIYFS